MSAKHFLSDPHAAVLACLHSLTLTNPAILFDAANKIIYRHPASFSSSSSSSSSSPQNVSLVCGGGSGHEPAFAGYVGEGLLTACVAGTIFASPGAAQIRTCLAHRLPAASKGTVVIVMNYTGDVLNFGMGVEKARAATTTTTTTMGSSSSSSSSKPVAMLIVADDVGVGRAKSGKVGRRGIAGAALVVKVCGALAAAGAEVAEIAAVGALATANVVSVAASLSRVHVPGRPAADADAEARRLPPGAVELGVGIHNEPGCERRLDADLAGTVRTMLAQLLDRHDADRAYVPIAPGDAVVLLVNNLGGLSNLELGAVTAEVAAQLERAWGLRPKRVLAGVFNGSLNGLGFGVSILKLADASAVSSWGLLELVDAPAQAVGWPQPIGRETWERTYEAVAAERGSVEEDERPRPSNLRIDPAQLQTSLTSALQAVIAAEPQITKYDTLAGDGDCGTGLKRGAEALLALISSPSSPPTADLFSILPAIIATVESTMDGTSGALYAIFLNALAHNLRLLDSSSSSSSSSSSPQTPQDVTPALWASALEKSLEALGRYTPAKPGDRTLCDALYPFVETLKRSGSVAEAARAAQEGAEGTRGMQASLGRTVYVGGREAVEVPDPGAWGLGAFFLGFSEGL